MRSGCVRSSATVMKPNRKPFPKEPLIKDLSMKISAHWIKKWERTEGQKGLRLQSGG